MSNWIFGNWYRATVAQGQCIIKTLPKGTKVVEVVVEIANGPMQGQRIKYNGYLNTKENAAKTRQDLINMGWRGTQWGDWAGLGGGKEFEVKAMSDEGKNGRVYARAAFPRPVTRVSTEYAATETDLDALNRELGDFEELDNIAEAQQHDLG